MPLLLRAISALHFPYIRSVIKIGLISDTHGYLDKKVFDVFKDVDEVWHAGDLGTIELCDELKKFKPFYAVYGNIDDKDIRIEYPLNLELEREGLKILMPAIGRAPPFRSAPPFRPASLPIARGSWPRLHPAARFPPPS